MTPSEHHPGGADSASELLSRRTQLQDWLRRLDDVGEDIPAQVARRVRADYEERLIAVVAELSAHSEALSDDRELLDEKLLAAAERHDAAVDALEESRLRHLIGELSDEDWESRRPGLESELEAAAGEREATEREIGALEELLTQLNIGVSANDEVTVEAGEPALPAMESAAYEVAAGDSESFVEEADEWVPQLPVLEAPAMEELAEDSEGVAGPEADAAQASVDTADEPPLADPLLDVAAYGVNEESRVDDDLVEITNFAAAAEALADEVDPPPPDDDYAFLQELDRAIAATAPSGEASEDDAATRPQPGLKCPDCGYSNDPAAWYCGVCGVDLG